MSLLNTLENRRPPQKCESSKNNRMELLELKNTTTEIKDSKDGLRPPQSREDRKGPEGGQQWDNPG